MTARGQRATAEAVGRPWAFELELTEGCTRYCSFCAIRSIRGGPGDFRFMTMATMAAVADQCARLAPTARYELAGRGEPLANPKHLQLLRLLRRAVPAAQIMVTTNGNVLLGRMQAGVSALLDAGVDFIIMDTYRPERDRLREEAAGLRGIPVWDYYDDCLRLGWSPYHHHHGKRGGPRLVLLDDISLRSGEHPTRIICNQAGNGGPPVPAPLGRVCTHPFRGIFVRWDGRLAICCDDWHNDLVIGNALEDGIEAAWRGRVVTAARRLLYSRDRNFAPCSGCDFGGGSRQGLLPRQEPPTEEDRRLVRWGAPPARGRIVTGRTKGE